MIVGVAMTAFLTGFAVACWLIPRVDEDDRARCRRVGWGYGYGAGVVDAQRGHYDPTAPPDGRTR